MHTKENLFPFFCLTVYSKFACVRIEAVRSCIFFTVGQLAICVLGEICNVTCKWTLMQCCDLKTKVSTPEFI